MNAQEMTKIIKAETRKLWDYLMMLEDCPVRNEKLISLYKTKWTTLDELCEALKIVVTY